MPTAFPIWATLTLGFFLGLKHALEADHLAAVSTIVSEERSLLRSSLIGAYWGMGHTAALLVFGSILLVFRLAVAPRVSEFLEFLVGLMLIFLGVKALLSLKQAPAVHVHTHEHGGTLHSHLHFHLGDSGHGHEHRVLRLGGKPFVVGVVHGMAGTAAVLLLIVGAIPSLLLGLGTILVFGVGSIGGMILMSLLMGIPLALAAGRARRVERVVRFAAGLFSLGFGIFIAWSVGVIQAFFA